MAIFTGLLRQLIAESGYSMRTLANKAGVDRPTLSKVLSGDRLPSPTYFHSLLRELKPSTQQKRHILKEFEKLRSGDILYNQRCSVKLLLENLRYYSNPSSAHTLVQYSNRETAAITSHRGLTEIGDALRHALRCGIQECGTLKQSNANLPESLRVYLSPSFPSTLLRLLLSEAGGLIDSSSPCLITVYHLLRFSKTMNIPGDIRQNLGSLVEAIPASLNTSPIYLPRYCYATGRPEEEASILLPCFALVGNILLLLSADGQQSFSITHLDMVDYYRTRIQAQYEESTPLVSSCGDFSEMLNLLHQTEQIDLPDTQISSQPCLAKYITSDIVADRLSPAIYAQPQFRQSITLRLKQLSQYHSCCTYFTEAGLRDFADTGYLQDFPKTLHRPLTTLQRKSVLCSLLADCCANPARFRLLCNKEFRIAPNTILNVNKNNSAFFYFTDSHSYRYICILESTVLEALQDFAHHLADSVLLLSSAETIKAVEKCIEKLG